MIDHHIFPIGKQETQDEILPSSSATLTHNPNYEYYLISYKGQIPGTKCNDPLVIFYIFTYLDVRSFL